MSRSGYVECSELDPLEFGRWRGRVASALRGERGQQFLREMADAMDAMPEKVLIAERIVEDGVPCAIGSALVARGMSDDALYAIDYEDPDSVGNAAGIASCMAAEIEYLNDDCGERYEEVCGPPVDTRSRMRILRIEETNAERWQRMREWIDKHLRE